MSRFVEHFSSHDSQPDPRVAAFGGRQLYSHYNNDDDSRQPDALPDISDLRISPQSPLSPETPQAISRSLSPSTSTMSESDSLAPETWIASFCSLLGHEYFAEVSEDFIEDDFNLTGLQSQVPMYKEALEMILDVEPEDDEDEEEEEEDDDDDEDMRDENGDPMGPDRRERRHMRAPSDLSIIESSAELLYGLIHQRYITSRPGIQMMAEKYESAIFGHCPRVMCNQTRTLPVGLYDTPGLDTVKLFCPSCLDVYTPPNSRFQNVDGAFFGTTFGCLFFMTFTEFEITPRGDPLHLASTHPIFATGTSNQPAAEQQRSNQSRSSSLTSNNLPPMPPPAVPAEWLPPADAPATINGVATASFAPGLGLGKIFEPKIYGFKVSERAKTGPRMRWLRSRPVDLRALDEAGHANGEYPDEDEEREEEDEEDEDMRPEDFYSRGGLEATPEIAGRKKAVAKSRRSAGAQKKPNAMETNGTGDFMSP